MTFSQFRNKITARFWWALVLILIINLISWSWINALKYNSLVSFKLNLNKDFYEIANINTRIGSNVVFNENSFANSYNINSSFVSKYYQEFLLSGSAIQKLKDINGLPNSAAIDKPLYTITILGNAVVEVRNEFDSEEDAKKFNDAIIKITKDEYSAWNQSKPEMLRLDLQEPESKVVVKPKPNQLKIIPTFVALILSLALIIIVPKHEKKS